MEPYLSLMVKVARSTALVVLLVFISSLLSAQNIESHPHSTKITLSCKKLTLIEVIASLSRITGLDFVYSSDKINSTQSISLDIQNESIDSALKRLSLLVDLDFRRQGQYVVIKSAIPDRRNSSQQHVEFISKQIPDLASMKLVDSIGIEQHIKITDERIIADKVTPHSVEPLEKCIIEFKPYISAVLLNRIPVQYMRRMNTRSKYIGWFTSLGLVANNFSAGAEVQGGVRSIYAVVNLARLRESKFRFGYGVGIAVPLSERFSLNPVYTRATDVGTKIETYTVAGGRRMNHEVKSSGRHDQLKVMIQYAFSSNVSARIGLTLNQEQIRYYYTELGSDKSKPPTPPVPPQTPPVPPSPTRSSIADPHTDPENQFPSHSTSRWLSWEAGVSYRINFSRHKKEL